MIKMDWKKIGVAWVFALAFTMLAFPVIAGLVIGGGIQPVSNVAVELTPKQESDLKAWYGFNDLDDGFIVGETYCYNDSNACTFAIFKKGLVDHNLSISLITCADVNCLSMREKTISELEASRAKAIEERIKVIAEAASQRLSVSEAVAKVGEGEITVNVK